MAAIVTGAALALADAAGLNAIARRSRRGQLLVLGYHGVVSRWHGDDQHTFRNTVSCEEFDHQLDVICRLFNPIGIDRLMASVSGEATLPERAVLVTFDDGYRNNLTNAAPLLEKHGVPALINVTTGYIGASVPLWPDEIELRIARWPHATIPMPAGEPPRDARTLQSRAAAAHHARERCKRIPDGDRRAYLEVLRSVPIEPWDADTEERLAFLSWDEVRQLARRGFDIGSHTVDHPILSRLTSAALAYQLEASRDRIEREIGRACVSVAYPNGQPDDVSQEVETAAARAGYRLGFTVTDGFNAPGGNSFAISRVCIPGHVSRSAFHARISGVHATLDRVVRRPEARARRNRGSQPGGRPALVPAAASLDVRLLTRFEDLEALAPDWDRLWDANLRAQVFSQFKWVRAWWRVYGARRSLCTPAVFEAGRLLGLLPLALDGDRWRFIGAPGSDYNDVLCEPGRANDVVRETLSAVLARLRPRQRCELENVSEASVIAAELAALPERIRARVQLRWSGPCPTVELSTDRDQIIQSILSKDSLRRHRNKLRRTGQLDFRHVTDRDEIRRLLPAFDRAHIARRAVAGERSSLI
jgi:peptidoglycan/xylan/chitin deacetylase (PgdA/CDA1 family)